MNVLVTGGVGYIGSCLLSMLREEGSVVNNIIRSLDCNCGKECLEVKRRFEGDKRYQIIVGDIRQHHDVKKSLDNIDVVIHLAAISGLQACMKNPADAIATNIYGTQKILEMAVNSDVERMIFASSAAVYGNPAKYPITEERQLKPLSLYGITKTAGEQLIDSYHNNYGLCTTVFRLANVYGLGVYTLWNTVTSLFVKAAVEGESMVIYGSGKQARNFVHVKDVAGAIIRCLKTGKKSIAGETFNVGGRESISIKELGNLILHLAQEESLKTVEFTHAPPRLGETYTPNFQYSITKAERILGYSPSVTLKEGIAELIHYAKKH